MPHVNFKTIQSKSRSGWIVLYTPTHGPVAEIEGFETEADAREWIELQAARWLDEREAA
jgi:hypothetical protein